MATRVGATVWPGRTCCSPLTTMTSLGASPLRHHAQAVDLGTEFDEAVLDAIVGGQRQHEFLGQIGADGTILDEDAVLILPADEAHPREEARRVAAVGVRERGARANRPGRRIDLIVDEVERGRVRIAVLVDESDIDRRGRRYLRAPESPGWLSAFAYRR